MSLSEKFKVVFMNTVVVSTAILFMLGVQATFAEMAGDGSIYFSWYHPFSIIFSGVSCSIPSLIFYTSKPVSKRNYILRIVIHCLILLVLVEAEGYLFSWYDSFSGAVAICVIYFVVYAFTWISNTWLTRKEDKKINEALNSIRDEE
ncbi:MAG: DUF3021 domain-containing protein [Lachnospiraceae bacterium]|nr:DUF3021 domain-containing protein [Lachnospiraceae bacterium]